MKRFANPSLLVLVLVIGTALVSTARSQPDLPTAESQPRTIGKIEQLDPRLDALVAPDAKIEVLADSFKWSEGPVWVPGTERAPGFLLFSDIPNNRVLRYSDATGCAEWLRPSGSTRVLDANARREPGSNGLALTANGDLLLCQHGDRRIARLSKAALGSTTLATAGTAQFHTMCDRFDGKRFNSPNDLVVGRDGSIWFTDPPYGLPEIDHKSREIDFHGVYRRGPDGQVHLVTDRIASPNGIALSPDGRSLYVADSNGKQAKWWVMTVTKSGDGQPEASKPRVFFEPDQAARERPGSCDGIAVSADGHIFGTGPGGVWVFTAEGQHLGTILTTRRTANCGFGGDDFKTLYMTANDLLLRVPLRVAGLR